LISLFGGVIGIIIGLALPFSVRFFTAYRLPISGWPAIIALLVSTTVGILFGTMPASRAARLDPVESQRHERPPRRGGFQPPHTSSIQQPLTAFSSRMPTAIFHTHP